MATRERLADLIELGDLDELVRTIDALVDERDWDGLVELRDRCRRALERGKQLWPAASLAEYRLALDAPGQWAATVLVEGAGQFALGPLAEVAASTHEWLELAPYLPHGPLSSIAAHERVVRGEDLTHDRHVDREVLELPLRLQPWEPHYCLASYKRDGATFESPKWPARTPVDLPRGVSTTTDSTTTEALRALVHPWVAGSNGRVEAVAVEGDALAAIAALGPRRAGIVRVDVGEAMRHMAWAAANGGAHGRRRGSALGRFHAWWALTTLVGLDGDDPSPDEIGDAAAELDWFLWDSGEPAHGWELRLAVADPHDGLGWALVASDQY